MKSFIKKNKKEIVFILIIAILTIVVSIYNIANLPKQIAIEKTQNKELKASLETVPSGYIGIYDVAGLRNISNNLSGKYILMADIDMAGEAFTPIGIDANSAFTGIFEGNDHTITNLTIESSNQYVGMFGYVKAGTVQNLKLESVNITNSLTKVSGYTGGVVGYSTGIINNIEIISGKVTGPLEDSQVYTGGITGYNTGEIANVKNNSEVTGVYVGGIVGYSTGTITEAENTGTIKGTLDASVSFAGGIVGCEYGSTTITKVKNVGTVKGSTSGGIAGITEVGITEAINTGTIIGDSFSGGIVGSNQTKTITKVEKTRKKIVNKMEKKK